MPKGLRALARYVWKYRRLAIPGLAMLIVSDACQLLVPLVLKSGIDGATARAWDTVRRACGELTLLVVVTVISRFAWRHFLFSAARLAEVDLRERLLEKVLSLPASYYSKTRTGEIMALATNDVSSVRMALAMGMVAGFDATVFALVAISVLAWMDWRLMLWTAIPFPLLAVVMAVALRMIYQRWDRVQAAFEDLTEKARESIAGMRVLRAYVQHEGDAADFDRFNQESYERRMSYVRVDSLFHPSILVLAGMSTAILVAVGGEEVIRGEMSLGSFTAFASYLGMLTWPMIAAGWVLTLVQRGAASMARVEHTLDLPPEQLESAFDRGHAQPKIRGGIEARALTFAYPETDRPALRDLTFQVKPGGTMGLVGEVGSGKSTLTLLLSRIYDPPEGTLFLDGVDVNHMDLHHLRRHVAYVPQEAFLFSDTIEENVRMGDAGADLPRVEEMTRLAAVDEDIRDFPHGYETLLGERGITLSGGQKQRISLARALLKASPILVLDDTLSAVDADAERRILDQLRGAMSGRTALVISHRISAVRDLDWILVLQEGRVAQAGTHDQLVSQPGYYREMYELQELEA